MNQSHSPEITRFLWNAKVHYSQFIIQCALCDPPCMTYQLLLFRRRGAIFRESI